MKDVLQYGLFLIILVGFFYFVYNEYKPQLLSWFLVNETDVRVYIADKPFIVSIADDEEERQQGLSGESELGRYEGKLFIFDQSARHGIWMKDMRFALDILWFDDSFRLIHIAERVEPDTYPQIFSPAEAARYVVELRAGTVNDLNISLGDPLNVPEVYIERNGLQ